MDVFDIIGPIMVGPSSSHTAGACRLGKFARMILEEEPKKVEIKLSGSFKRTYKGHGTDKAIVAGLIGFDEDDERIKNSVEIAKSEGRDIKIVEEDIENAHANTALIIMTKTDGSVVQMQGSSTGGGNILITKINDTKVAITGVYDTLIVRHLDVAGMIYKITNVLYKWNVNINSLSLSRSERSGMAVVVIEVDDKIRDSICDEINAIENVTDVVLLSAI